jgi:hypothetical protein
MGTKSSKMILAVIISLFILGSGVWVVASGRPFNGGVLAAHKLLALVGVVFFGVTLFQINRALKLGAIQTVSSLLTGLLFLAAIVSGASASQNAATAAAISTHRLTLTLTLVSAIVTLLLLLRGK